MAGQAEGFVPAPRHAARYADREIARRPNASPPLGNKSALQRPLEGLPPLGPSVATPDRDIRGRLEMLLAVDESLGRILDVLRETGELDRTVIIFTSDNGYFYGQHYLNEERRLAYEESIRLPLIVRFPPYAVAGAERGELVQTIDLAPTILEFAGLTDSVRRDGRSLAPLRRGDTVAWSPDERFSSAREVRTSLDDALSDSPTVRGASAGAAESRRGAIARIGALPAALAVCAAAYWAFDRFVLRPAPLLAFQARDWILITDFDNQTGDPVFDRSLKTALTVRIQQSRYVNVFSDNRIQETLQRMRKSGVERIDETIGAEIAVRDGIKGVLACSIARVGDTYALTARVVDPKSHDTVLTAAREATNMHSLEF